MPAPRKYDQETRDRAVRMYLERRREYPAEPAIESRRQVGALIDVKSETMRGWVERVEVDARTRPGTTSDDQAELIRLGREVLELKRAGERLSHGWTCVYCQQHRSSGRGALVHVPPRAQDNWTRGNSKLTPPDRKVALTCDTERTHYHDLGGQVPSSHSTGSAPPVWGSPNRLITGP